MEAIASNAECYVTPKLETLKRAARNRAMFIIGGATMKKFVWRFPTLVGEDSPCLRLFLG